MHEYLKNSGFIRIEVINKENSDDIIRGWNFGSGVERAVFSAYVKAVKPEK